MPGILDITVDRDAADADRKAAGLPPLEQEVKVAPEPKAGVEPKPPEKLADGLFSTSGPEPARSVSVDLPGEKPQVEKGPNHKKFEEVVTARKKAEALAEEHRLAVEARTKEIEDLRRQMSEREAALAAKQGEVAGFVELQQANERLAAELEEAKKERVAMDITQDPDFVAKFDAPAKAQVARLGQLAESVGHKQAEIDRAIEYGDEDTLAGIRDLLPVAQQRVWDASMQRREMLKIEREEAVKDSRRTFSELQEKRQQAIRQQQQQQLQKNIQESRGIVESLWTAPEMEAFKGDADLRKHVERILEVASGKGSKEEVSKWTSAEFLRRIAIGEVLASIIPKQGMVLDAHLKNIETLKSDVAAKDAKIAELEGFIKTRYGSLPSSDGGDAAPPRGGNGNGFLKPGESFFGGISVKRS
jgi:hypothetical protein